MKTLVTLGEQGGRAGIHGRYVYMVLSIVLSLDLQLLDNNQTRTLPLT